MSTPPRILPRHAFRARSLDGDLHRSRLRQRYLESQFPDYAALKARGAASAEIIALANSLYEDGEKRIAAELLTVALQDHPQDKSLWLALAELYYLEADAAQFAALFEAFFAAFSDAAERTELRRLGARLDPMNALFREASPTRHETIPGWLRPARPPGDDDAAANVHRLLTLSTASP
ncbi:MAG: hypothetical protein JNM76_09470 [Betaproteobacteria bacterium]|nr:hypothetical protein [Betaproteobacteria bacterium]